MLVDREELPRDVAGMVVVRRGDELSSKINCSHLSIIKVRPLFSTVNQPLSL